MLRRYCDASRPDPCLTEKLVNLIFLNHDQMYTFFLIRTFEEKVRYIVISPFRSSINLKSAYGSKREILFHFLTYFLEYGCDLGVKDYGQIYL